MKTNPVRGKAAGVGSIPTASTNFCYLFHMLNKSIYFHWVTGPVLCLALTLGIALLTGCKTVNKVNPISDESYCHWIFGLPHKAVKTVLDIDEE
jgi:hypothetical protein